MIESACAFSIIPLLQVGFPAINNCQFFFCRTFGLCFVLEYYSRLNSGGYERCLGD